MEEHVVQALGGLFPALDALQLIETIGGLITQQQGGESTDAHFQLILRRGIHYLAVTIGKADGERPVIPGQQGVLDFQVDAELAAIGVAGIIFQKALQSTHLVIFLKPPLERNFAN